jgi:hypothetical protein
MGVIKGIFVFLVCSLLFLSLFSTILFLNLSNSLEYQSLQKNSASFIKEIIKNKTNFDDLLSENIGFMQVYCSQNISSDKYSLSLENYTLDIPCNENLTLDYVLDEGVKDLSSQIYFKEYNCKFIDCFGQEEIPLFLVSQKTYALLIKSFYISLLVSFGLIILLFFLLEKKSNLFIISGALLLIPSILFSYLNKIPSLIQEPLISRALGIFFMDFYSLSIKMIIFSISLMVIGILLRVFKIGFLISNLFNKEKIKEVKDKPLETKTDKTSTSNKKQDSSKK